MIDWIRQAASWIWFSTKCAVTTHIRIKRVEESQTTLTESLTAIDDRLAQYHREAQEGRKELHQKVDRLMLHLVPKPTGGSED